MRQLVFLALLVALGYLLMSLLSPKRRIGRSAAAHDRAEVIHELVQDPCCQTYLPRAQAIRRTIHRHEYFFCSTGCLEKFLASHS